MALQTSGPISLGNIRTELGSSATNFSLKNAETGFYSPINSASPLKPNGISPYYISEWYGYNHTFSSTIPGNIFFGGIFNTYTYDGVFYTAGNIIYIKATGEVNTGFNTTLNGGTNVGYNGEILTSVEYGGVVYVGGRFTTYQGLTTSRYTGLSRSTGLKVLTTEPDFNGVINSIALTKDGTPGIICGGAFTRIGLPTKNRIIRLNTNGSENTSFAIGTGFNNEVTTVAVDDNNKVICGGRFTSYKSTGGRTRLARLLANGGYDTTFVTGAGLNNTPRFIKIQSDGKILVGGEFTSYKGTTCGRICRILTNGDYDTTFVTGTGFNGTVRAIEVQSDGKILVGGEFTTYNGTSSFGIIRLNSNGSRDGSFLGEVTRSDTIVGAVVGGRVNVIHINQEYPNQIFVGGWFDYPRVNLVAFDQDGNYTPITYNGNVESIGTSFADGQINTIAQNSSPI